MNLPNSFLTLSTTTRSEKSLQNANLYPLATLPSLYDAIYLGKESISAMSGGLCICKEMQWCVHLVLVVMNDFFHTSEKCFFGVILFLCYHGVNAIIDSPQTCPICMKLNNEGNIPTKTTYANH